MCVEHVTSEMEAMKTDSRNTREEYERIFFACSSSFIEALGPRAQTMAIVLVYDALACI